MINNKIDFKVDDLPALPEIVSLMLIELNSEEPDFDILEKLIYNDPFITTKLLNLANSSYFNLFRKVNNIGDALKYIGYRRLFNVVLMLGISKNFSNIKGIDLYSFWRYSLNVSKLSFTFSEKISVDKDTALTIGLIHAIGELIMHLKISERINYINDFSSVFSNKRAFEEKRNLGYTYLDITSAFIKQNRFSPLICQTIKEQALIANDVIKYSEISDLGLVIYLATWIVRAKDSNKELDSSQTQHIKEISAILNLNETDVLSINEDFWVTKEDVAMVI